MNRFEAQREFQALNKRADRAFAVALIFSWFAFHAHLAFIAFRIYMGVTS